MENFKDITEHQLEVGEVGVLKGNKYLACRGCNNYDYDCYKCTFSATNNSDECMNSNIHCNNIFFQLVAKKEDIDPILESIDDTSDDGSDSIETITITKSEYKDLLYHSLYYCEELSEIDRHNKELKVKIDKLHSKIKDLLNGRDNNS